MALMPDDRLLGEKTHYYCSSSEDEAENSDDSREEDECNGNGAAAIEPSVPGIDPKTYGGTCVNTGPKGVLRDYRRYKQLETEQRDESVRERDQLAKKLAMTCKTSEEESADRELEELLEGAGDEFLAQYREQRMRELNHAVHLNNPTFGHVVALGKDDLVDAVDKENARVTVIIHLYEEDVAACQALSGCLKCLANSFPHVKFCELKSSEARMSHKFRECGVPALLAYKNGELVDTHVRLADQLGEDFFANDLEAFLVEHGLLPNSTEIAGSIRSSKQQADDSDSDFDLD